MRKCTLFVFLCLLCLSMSPATSLSGHIGLYADPEGLSTEIVVRQGEPTMTYFIAHVPELEDGIVGAGFSIPDWPSSGLDCVIAVDWLGSATIGDIESGISIARTGNSEIWESDASGNVVFGTATFCAYEDDWLEGGNHFEFADIESDWNSWPISVIDPDFVEHEVDGDSFTFIFLRTPVAQSTISLVKSLY